MATLVWAVSCETIITDRARNTVSYIESIEELGVPKLPYPFMPLFVGTLWARERENEPLSIRIRVNVPDGSTAFSFDVPEQRMERPRHRVNVQVGGFKVEETGVHEVIVEQLLNDDWIQQARIPVDVKLVATEKV